ncbi:hypothetical protein G6F64_015118 [Rhizopus arrhizus]|uniref:EF-hand domain-containing protein n=1 Tax=Rhizopus oryzae TaxID=64495 RepID=A0A9P6WSW8_RHIOR|nr:hypothetical protein G6F64_015118 [Rhizopus arrhizus]
MQRLDTDKHGVVSQSEYQAFMEESFAKLDTNASKRDAEKIAAKDAFDVLVVGGGPAGAAAAIYAARKGIRTGIAAERRPKARSWPRRWNSTCASTTWTS